MLNRSLYIMLRLAEWTMPVCPVSLLYAVARAAGWISFYLVKPARVALACNLSVVLRRPPTAHEVRRTARRAFQNDAMNWVDTLRIHRLQPQQIEALVHVEHFDWIDEMVDLGRGLIVATLHLGNVDLVGQILAARGYRLTVPVERIKPPELFDFLMDVRRSQGINVVSIEDAPRAMLRALHAGELVGLAIDRHVAGRTGVVDLFGSRARMPLAPVTLARRLQAPLVLGTGVRVRPGHFEGIVERVELQFTGDADRDDAANLQSLARVAEDLIARFPDQWLMFSSFWTEGGGREAADTMGHQKRAAV